MRGEGFWRRSLSTISHLSHLPRQLSEIPFAVMIRMKAVKGKFLLELSHHSALYDKCPPKIKRQIWAVDAKIFQQQLDPLVEATTASPESAQQQVTPYLAFADALDASVREIWIKDVQGPRDRRRVTPSLGKILDAVDRSVALYKNVLDSCARAFRDTGNPLYCTLRCDVLMALHDAGVSELYTQDRCHDYAWILDAAANGRLTELLLNDLEQQASHDDAVRADQAMMLANPFALHTVLRSLCLELAACVETKVLPRDSRTVVRLCALLHSGCTAVARVKDPLFHYPMPRSLTRTVCPWLAGIIVDVTVPSEADIQLYSGQEPPEILEACQAEPAARKLVLAFTAKLIMDGETLGLRMLLGLAESIIVMPEDLDFVQSIVTILLRAQQTHQRDNSTNWRSGQVLQVVMDSFLSHASRLGPAAHKQAIRLALGISGKGVATTSVLEYVQTLIENAPAQDSEEKDIGLMYVELAEVFDRTGVDGEKMLFLLRWLGLVDDAAPPGTNDGGDNAAVDVIGVAETNEYDE